MESAFSHLECARCEGIVRPDPPWTVSPCCSAPLISRYDLERARRGLPAPGAAGPRGLWRYRAVLPLPIGAAPVTLGEGGTPMLPIPAVGAIFGSKHLVMKDESANPTGSFKDRGLGVAVSLAKAFGVAHVILPTAGNAGSSAAAYANRAGLCVSIHAPEGTPTEILTEIRFRGASLTLHPGSISDAGRAAGAEAAERGSHSLATFREPGRLEGKKTMAYEIREQLGRLPDAIVYPCGGGTGIVAMAQAIDEMRGLGWIGTESARLYAVQAEGCAPIVEAHHAGRDTVTPWEHAATFAAGLRVPTPFADREILTALKRSEGGAIAVTEREIVEAGLELARTEGILPCPEGAAALAGARRLLADGSIGAQELTVVFQTGSGLKYLEAWRDAATECQGEETLSRSGR